MKPQNWKTTIVLGAGLLLGAPLAASAAADPVADFYKGKNIDLYIGFSQGGGYDAYARLVGRFIGDRVPGGPKVIPRQKVGAGSLTAINFVYTIAPKDGTVLATADQALPLNQLIDDPGVKYDSSKLIWIGNPNADVNIVVTWHTTGIKTIDDAKKRVITMGATGPVPNTSALYPQLLDTFAGTKFKTVTGYPGGADVDLAMERGELDGRGSDAWASLKATKSDWVRDKKVNILVQIGLAKAKDLPDPPLLMDIAKNDSDRALLKLLSATTTIGRPLFSTPDVPKDRVAALRKAFDDTVKDPAFRAEAAKEKLDVNPVSGAELQKIVADMLATPKPVVTRLKAVFAGKE
jgi:tripartite-type tricarboxylate transporter receptor subunit TctC